MSADTITVHGLNALIKMLNDARLDLLDLRVRAEIGQVSPEKAAEILKEIGATVAAAFRP